MTAEATPPRATPPLLSLQVLRAVAALLVLVHHAAYDADTIAARTGSAPFGVDRFVDLGFGIHLFFVISGFIMLRTAQGFGSGRGAAVFMARRILRVVPLYWLMTSLVLVGTALSPGLLNTAPGGFAWMAGSYLFVPLARGGGGEINPILGQGWTLDFEMFFYVLFAFAMLMPRRAAVPALAATLMGLVVLGRLLAVPVAAVAIWTDGLLLEFLFGLGLALAAERSWRLGPVSASATVALGAAAWVVMGPMAPRFDALAPWWREGVPAALVVGGCVLGPRWPANRVVMAMAMVGDASYSLYLSHPFAIRLLRGAWLAALPAGTPTLLYLAAACAAAIVGAQMLHRRVERPMTDWLQRHSRIADVARRPILPRAVTQAD